MKISEKNFTGSGDSERRSTCKDMGAVFTALRKEKGYANGEKFAAEHGFNRSTWYRVENGSNISFDLFVEALSALGVSFTEFGTLLDRKIANRGKHHS